MARTTWSAFNKLTRQLTSKGLVTKSAAEWERQDERDAANTRRFAREQAKRWDAADAILQAQTREMRGKAYTVACPTCRAAPKRKCITSSGKVASKPHQKRYNLANRAGGPNGSGW